MPRSALAYLSDVVDACDAIAVTLDGVDLPSYEATRTLRSAVEREFTIIGEAVNALQRLAPARAARISHARKIVGFRNPLVPDYPAIIDATVWAIARNDAPVLRRECAALIDELGTAG
ncbi:MAG: DUF86 domain-containing protein [Thermoleophilia bacterium]|nr:DUF86 domain-containing protein [Thermoleophilia bacterium]